MFVRIVTFLTLPSTTLMFNNRQHWLILKLDNWQMFVYKVWLNQDGCAHGLRSLCFVVKNNDETFLTILDKGNDPNDFWFVYIVNAVWAVFFTKSYCIYGFVQRLQSEIRSFYDSLFYDKDLAVWTIIMCLSSVTYLS